MTRPTIAYVIEPRFPGGTSAAVAQELAYAARAGRLVVHAVTTSMFQGREIAPALQAALDALGLTLVWDAPSIRGDLVVFHNPSALRFDEALATRIVCRRLVIVAHENFQRPGGTDAFDVEKTLRLLDQATTALEKCIAPVSAYNRETVVSWLTGRAASARWQVTPYDWINICDFEWAEPTATPRDRRGRHSRAGFEKFPQDAVMDVLYPSSADANIILGGDILMDAARTRPHWSVLEFGAMPVPEFLRQIDFFVYYTAPTWRESFGRVLAEATAAGKAVISDPETAKVLGPGALTGSPEDVTGIIARLCGDPAEYAASVRAAQDHLRTTHSPDAFRNVLLSALEDLVRA